MPLIQRADLAERIRRAFGVMTGSVNTLSPEIVPVVVVEDLTGPAIDTGFPRLCAARIVAGASAGVFSEVFLINPSSSRVDVITQEWWVQNLTAAESMYFNHGVAADLNNMLGTQTLRLNLDLRVNHIPNAQIDSRNQAARVGTLGITFANPVTTVVTKIPLQFTLGPGDWVSVAPSVNNHGLDCQVFWYERLRTTT